MELTLQKRSGRKKRKQYMEEKFFRVLERAAEEVKKINSNI